MLKGIFSSSTAKDKKAAPGAAADEDEDDKDDDMVIEVEENERFSDKSGWSKINLKIGVDPKTFVYSGGTQASDTFPTKLAVADGWEFKGKWYIYIHQGLHNFYFITNRNTLYFVSGKSNLSKAQRMAGSMVLTFNLFRKVT